MGGLSKLSRNKRTETAKKRLSEQSKRTEQNKKLKIAKHLRFHPNDLQTSKVAGKL